MSIKLRLILLLGLLLGGLLTGWILLAWQADWHLPLLIYLSGLLLVMALGCALNAWVLRPLSRIDESRRQALEERARLGRDLHDGDDNIDHG